MRRCAPVLALLAAACEPAPQLPPPDGVFPIHTVADVGGDDDAARPPPDAAPPSLCGKTPETAAVEHVPQNLPARHEPEGTTIEYDHDPPANGPHYPVWVRRGEYDDPIPRSYWVHNLEHQWMVLLYRPDADRAAIDALRQAYRTLPADPGCDAPRALLTADPLLPTPVAAVGWDFVLAGDSLDAAAIDAFFTTCRSAGPEAGLCDDGAYPYQPASP
jgi:hypothetical protein